MNHHNSQVNNRQADNSGIFRYPTRQEIIAARAQSKAQLSNENDDNDNGDLSGCLASQGFAGKQPAEPKRAVEENYRDEDLSGCLASGFLKSKPAEPKRAVEDNYRDEDLSGCLASGFLKSKQQQTIPRDRFKPTQRDSNTGEIKPTERDDISENLQPLDEDKSGWLYFN
jgi:hypothetical protein